MRRFSAIEYRRRLDWLGGSASASTTVIRDEALTGYRSPTPGSAPLRAGARRPPPDAYDEAEMEGGEDRPEGQGQAEGGGQVERGEGGPVPRWGRAFFIRGLYIGGVLRRTFYVCHRWGGGSNGVGGVCGR
jgi:hypothetical protein